LVNLAASPGLVLALILVVTAVVYAQIIGDWFKMDDFSYLHGARTKSAMEYIPQAFNFRGKEQPVAILDGAYRPLFASTILAEGDVFGVHPVPYHLVSILVHLANIALVWVIARRLMQRLATAHMAAFVFALHPTYVPTVGWISEHTAMLATLMALLSFWSFMKAREAAGGGRWYALSLAAYLAAMLYHPKAAPIIVAFVAYAALVPRRGLRELIAPKTWLWVVPFAVTAAFPLIIGYDLRSRSFDELIVYRYGPHVYTNFLWYLRMSLWPRDLRAEASFANTLPTCLIWFGIALWLLLNANRRQHLVALVWYATALVPLTSFAWGAHPRELYIAAPGLALVLAAVVVTVFDALAESRWALGLATGACSALAVCAIALTAHNAGNQGSASREARAFIAQLQREQPTLSAADTLYIVGPPFTLILFGPSNLNEAVHVFYPDVTVALATEAEAKAIDAAHDPHSKVIRVSGK
jgi:hypothetical protein